VTRERRYYSRVALIAYAVWLAAFEAVGIYANTLPTRDLTSAADQGIPCVPEFVWAYGLCYVFPFLPLFLVRDWHRVNRALLAIALASVTAFAVYLLLPIAFPRPVLGDSLSERLLAMEYAADFSPGANKLPSLHVIFAWIICFVCYGQTAKRYVDAVVIGIAILISISTLFVKQHILLDVACGFACACGAWLLATRIYVQRVDPQVSAITVMRQMTTRLFGRVLARGDFPGE
jgi:membrane-associated phospholipid phosphatase